MTTDPEEQLLTAADLATNWGVPVRTIYKWRAQGTGPRGIRVGKHLRFRRRDCEAWLDAQADRLGDQQVTVQPAPVQQVKPTVPVRQVRQRRADRQVKQVGAVG